MRTIIQTMIVQQLSFTVHASQCACDSEIIYNHYSNRRNNTTFRMWRMGYSKSLKPLKQSAREVIKMAFHLLKLRDQTDYKNFNNTCSTITQYVIV